MSKPTKVTSSLKLNLSKFLKIASKNISDVKNRKINSTCTRMSVRQKSGPDNKMLTAKLFNSISRSCLRPVDSYKILIRKKYSFQAICGKFLHARLCVVIGVADSYSVLREQFHVTEWNVNVISINKNCAVYCK